MSTFSVCIEYQCVYPSWLYGAYIVINQHFWSGQGPVIDHFVSCHKGWTNLRWAWWLHGSVCSLQLPKCVGLRLFLPDMTANQVSLNSHFYIKAWWLQIVLPLLQTVQDGRLENRRSRQIINRCGRSVKDDVNYCCSLDWPLDESRCTYSILS